MMVAEDASIAAEHKYAVLRELVPSVWTLAALPGNGHLPSLPLKQIIALSDAYRAEPREWIEDGVRTAGTEGACTQAFSACVTRKLLSALPADCDLVLDLGCGWGHRSFDLYLAGLKAAAFLGGEQNKFGRALYNFVAQNYHPNIAAGAYAFDFLRPTFGVPAGLTPSRIGVFTICAIEQVQTLGESLFSALFSTYPDAEITGVHIEPLTFQLPDAPSGNRQRHARNVAHNTLTNQNTDLYAILCRRPDIAVTAVEPVIFDNLRTGSISAFCWKRI